MALKQSKYIYTLKRIDSLGQNSTSRYVLTLASPASKNVLLTLENEDLYSLASNAKVADLSDLRILTSEPQTISQDSILPCGKIEKKATRKELSDFLAHYNNAPVYLEY
jgi:hypothetical protein